MRQGAYLWVPGPLGGGERLRSSDGEVGAPPALGRHHVVYLQRPPAPNTIGCRCSSASRGAAPEPAIINAQKDSQELLEPVALQVQQPRSVRASMPQWRSPPPSPARILHLSAHWHCHPKRPPKRLSPGGSAWRFFFGDWVKNPRSVTFCRTGNARLDTYPRRRRTRAIQPLKLRIRPFYLPSSRFAKLQPILSKKIFFVFLRNSP